ncbi:MAG TPA: sodium:glutamate symporter, partial [Bacillus bacterium]|nr:sodium:glutamate symporter [Bacillus sp. (in: firmicutes)]
MEFDSILLAFVLIGALLAFAKFLRMKIKFFQKYFIPTSLIAGLIGLLLSEDVLGRFASFLDMQVLTSGIYPEKVRDVMIDLPEIGITIIFASLFLGKKIPGV